MEILFEKLFFIKYSVFHSTTQAFVKMSEKCPSVFSVNFSNVVFPLVLIMVLELEVSIVNPLTNGLSSS